MTLKNHLLNSRAKIDRSGRELVRVIELDAIPESQLAVLNEWRSFHTFPLNSITVSLKGKARRIQDNSIVVQRLKRTRSIISKLINEPSMRLTQMQDIGGCRAVLDSIDSVYELKNSYLDSKGQFEIVHIDDYIRSPKASGYRSIHIILRYNSLKYPEYNRLLLEVQARTTTQHAWATAVETVGAVTNQALKSSEGEDKWLRYFQNASLALESLEKPLFTTIVPKSLGEIARTIESLDSELKVAQKLHSYRNALKATESNDAPKDGYFLLVLLPAQAELQIFHYPKRRAEEAYRAYNEYERTIPLRSKAPTNSQFLELANYSGAQAVLVGAESFHSLRQSYPNYYLDTDLFLQSIQAFVKRHRRSR